MMSKSLLEKRDTARDRAPSVGAEGKYTNAKMATIIVMIPSDGCQLQRQAVLGT